MDDRVVADGDEGADGVGEALIAVDDGVLLHVGPLSDGDGCDVASDDGPVPDIHVRAEGNFTKNSRGVGDVTVLDAVYTHGSVVYETVLEGSSMAGVSVRIFVLGLMVAWLGVIAPSHHHRHGAGTDDAGVVASGSCVSDCGSAAQKQAASERARDESTPGHDDDGKDCQVCHLIASFIPQPDVSIKVPEPELLSILPEPPLAALSGVELYLISRGRGPPACA